jgi:hypothetical protein
VMHLVEEKFGMTLLRVFFFFFPIVVQPQCTVDADCASKLACFSGTCRNPCIETKPCAVNAACTVVDTLPLRTMSCSCLPGFVGDADVECKPGMFSYC